MASVTQEATHIPNLGMGCFYNKVIPPRHNGGCQQRRGHQRDLYAASVESGIRIPDEDLNPIPRLEF